jgi:hypothetical protein
MPGPQSNGRASTAFETALSAAVPIKVNTTRRERFTMWPSLVGNLQVSPSADGSGKPNAVISRHRACQTRTLVVRF